MEAAWNEYYEAGLEGTVIPKKEAKTPLKEGFYDLTGKFISKDFNDLDSGIYLHLKVFEDQVKTDKIIKY